MSIEIICVEKIEAAKRQLETAIKLWFTESDQISVHTLACAAYQIVHDINKNNKGNELLLDSSLIKNEFRKEYISEMRKAMSFFKHADKDPDPHGTVEFAHAITDLYIIYSIIGIERLGEPRSELSAAFLLFYAMKNPNLITKEFSDHFNIEIIANLPVISKLEFMEQFLLMRRQGTQN